MIISQTESLQQLNSVHAPEFIESINSTPLKFNDMVITSVAGQEIDPVALRCEAPLDAIELDNHGYHYGFFERGNDICLETFATLNQLSIHTLAYFCDVNGPQFDLSKMAEFAKHHNIKLCKVLLPFNPCDFALWDEWQWRIFDMRLSLALSHIHLNSNPMKFLNGGLNNATIH
jgi:hypothetical protein